MPGFDLTAGNASAQSASILPDHPAIEPQLRDASGNRKEPCSSPRKLTGSRQDEHDSFDKPTRMKRSASFKYFLPIKDMSRSPVKSPRKKVGSTEEKSVKKSKSSSSLSNLLSRPRSSKGTKAEAHAQKEKENLTPPHTADVERPPPIWSQFATMAANDDSKTKKVPLNDHRDGEEEVAYYSSKAHSPIKQKQSQHSGRRTPPSRTATKTRPRSDCLGSGPSSTNMSETLSGLRRLGRNKDDPNAEQEGSIPSLDAAIGNEPWHKTKERIDLLADKRGSSVLATAALFDEKARSLPQKLINRPASAPLNPEAVESAFETLLDTRNVPLATRDKMRSLDTNIKADFIRQDKVVSSSASSTDGFRMQHAMTRVEHRSKSHDRTLNNTSEPQPTTSPKKSRPRSLTFTLSKGDQSPSKRQKSGNHQRTKSGDSSPSESSNSSALVNHGRGLSFLTRTDTFALPEQVIAYLRKFPAPQSVEVGKVQKLRQLLRNETVGWVEAFVTQGGMTETVGLLYRTVAVEWREEHEDILLHEILLCLKALSTTSSAMAQISEIQNTLFPTLLQMLFDDERKGPSEYNTRTIVVNLLLSYLATSIAGTFASRARTLLGYLRDKVPPQEARAPEFISSIYHPRPYRIWHKELNNLTKEVFWIFLHHHNIIPYGSYPPGQSSSYQQRHFPKDHPPVAAAPYIGGVEWDATGYATAHLDLINGLMASLPTKVERNQLRQEMKDSGFEKLMGGSLRTCKEKFYGSVHEALSLWVSAAHEDGWPDKDVRQGPPKAGTERSPVKKGKKNQAPMLEMPKFDVNGGVASNEGGGSGGWL